MRQQVLATYPEGKVPDELIADRGVKQEEVLLLLVVTDGGIKSTDILQPSHDAQAVTVVVGTEESLIFRGSQYRVLHVQQCMVGGDVPMLADAIGSLQFSTVVLHFPRVHITRFAIHGHRLNHVVTLQIEEVDAVGQRVKPVFPRQFVVHQTFRFQVLVRGRVEIHLPHGRIAEPLAHHCFQLTVVHRTDDDAPLWNPLRPRDAMVVDTDARINRQPRGEVLPELHIARYLVAIRLAALFVGRVQCLTRLL